MDKIIGFTKLLQDHERLRARSLNLVSSENVLSPRARTALANDMAGRYSSEFYGGTSSIRKVIGQTQEFAKELFQCEYACVTPISGHLCDLAALNSLTAPKDKIALINKDVGGYPFDIEAFHRKKQDLPFDTWLRENEKFRLFIKEKLDAFKLRSFIIPETIDAMLQEHMNYERNYMETLSTLVNLELVLEQLADEMNE